MLYVLIVDRGFLFPFFTENEMNKTYNDNKKKILRHVLTLMSRMCSFLLVMRITILALCVLNMFCVIVSFVSLKVCAYLFLLLQRISFETVNCQFSWSNGDTSVLFLFTTATATTLLTSLVVEGSFL